MPTLIELKSGHVWLNLILVLRTKGGVLDGEGIDGVLDEESYGVLDLQGRGCYRSLIFFITFSTSI